MEGNIEKVFSYRQVAVVGGGKTSLIFHLARRLTGQGKKVIVAASTHMARDSRHPFALWGDGGQLNRNLSEWGWGYSVVVGVAGLDALSQTIAEGCRRPELTAALLGQDLTHRITEEDIAKVCLDARGPRKDVGERLFWIVLNKADDEKIRRRGEKIRKRIMERRSGQWVGVTSLKHV